MKFCYQNNIKFILTSLVIFRFNDLFILALRCIEVSIFAGKVMMSYSSNWFTLLLLCTSAPLVLCCDRFDNGSRQVKRDQVDLVTEDYDVSLCQRIVITFCCSSVQSIAFQVV